MSEASSNPDTNRPCGAHPSALRVPHSVATPATLAERILADLWAEYAISATLKVKKNLNRIAEREFNRQKRESAQSAEPSTLLRATSAPGHAVPKLGPPGTKPLNNAAAKALAEQIYEEMRRTLASDSGDSALCTPHSAIALALQHFNRAHDREDKGHTIRQQVARTGG